jgi:hypothetical protein
VSLALGKSETCLPNSPCPPCVGAEQIIYAALCAGGLLAAAGIVFGFVRSRRRQLQARRTQLLQSIDELVALLSIDLPDGEVQHGWSNESRDAIREALQEMRADVAARKDVGRMPDWAGVARGLDAWGIDGGALAEKAYALVSLAKDCSR